MGQFTCSIISYTLQRTVELSVILPTPTNKEFEGGKKVSFKPKAPYPILYLLHGGVNDYSTMLHYTNIERYAEERQIAVVCISGENKAYIKYWMGDDFYTFIAEELPDFLSGIFPISTRPEDSFIAGLSMGGFGTLYHGLRRPDKFCAMGVFSAVTRCNPYRIMRSEEEYNSFHIPESELQALDLEALASKVAVSGIPFPKIYMALGEKDPLVPMNLEFRDVLMGLGAEVSWHLVPGYGHEWDLWDKLIRDFLDWIPRTDIYYQECPIRPL